MKPITNVALERWASGRYLVCHLPNNWQDMCEEDRIDFVGDNAANPYGVAEDILDSIYGLVRDTKKFLKSHEIEVVE